MKYKNKGFTLVELLIVIGIMGIIITAIFSFFLSNIKTFHRADDHIQVQYNVQNAMNKMVEEIIGTQEIVDMEPKQYNVHAIPVSKMIFKIKDDKYVQFDYDSSTQTLSYGSGSSENSITRTKCAVNIIDFQIEIIGATGIDFDSSEAEMVEKIKKIKGIKIKIISNKNDSRITLNNQVYFRNAKK